jgi:hypothetical protein
MLSSPVYAETHPRRNVAHRNFSNSLRSFNSFIFNGFRTLSYQWTPATLSLSIGSGLFPLQWRCIPLALSSSTASSPVSSISRRPSHFSSTAYKMLLPQLLCFDNDPFSWGVYTPTPTGSGGVCRVRWRRRSRLRVRGRRGAPEGRRDGGRRDRARRKELRGW